MGRSEAIIVDGIGKVLLERSKRSKHLNIFVMPGKGVRVAIPYGISFRDAEAVVRSKISWIRKQLVRMEQFEKKYAPLLNGAVDIDTPGTRRKLLGRVKELAGRHGFIYNKVAVRNQKTRWGSCSPGNNISLNVKLLQLPEELADYIIFHELMHTRIKNHQKEFWSELDKLVGDAKKLDSRLREYHLELI